MCFACNKVILTWELRLTSHEIAGARHNIGDEVKTNMATIGSIEHYNMDMDLEDYLERLEQYCITNDIGVAVSTEATDVAQAKKKKVATLLT